MAVFCLITAVPDNWSGISMYAYYTKAPLWIKEEKKNSSAGEICEGSKRFHSEMNGKVAVENAPWGSSSHFCFKAEQNKTV